MNRRINGSKGFYELLFLNSEHKFSLDILGSLLNENFTYSLKKAATPPPSPYSM